MSAFYIGQRVRVARCYNPDLMHYVGIETTIVGRMFGEWVLPLKGPVAGDVTAPSECLEPTIPPGLESPAEIAALYEPEDAIA